MKVKVKTTGEIIDVHFSHNCGDSVSNEKVYSDSFTGKYYYASELERLTESMQPKFDQFWAGQISAFKGILKILDTIEVKESENERIREALIALLKFGLEDGSAIAPGFNETKEQALAWLEKQGKETSWKPSKEEMDVLYGLAYITNKYDEHKEEVITRLYQDLKREFFNGSSYENMFPNTENDVRRRSTIQMLEYARSLDNYNQYGKADIDKNIAWLEKQGKKPQG